MLTKSFCYNNFKYNFKGYFSFKVDFEKNMIRGLSDFVRQHDKKTQKSRETSRSSKNSPKTHNECEGKKTDLQQCFRNY